jgi:DNA-binding response OmpR family regulator
MGTRILVVASDSHVRATVLRWLASAGYAVELAESVRHARDVLANVDIAVAIIAPQGLGGEAVAMLRGNVGHLIIIADQEAIDAVPPIEPDVSMSEPSAEQDLVSRVGAALEEAPAAARQAEPSLLRFEGYTLDAGGRTMRNAGGQDIALTRAEFSMLLALARQAGRVLSRDELSQAATGRGAQPEDRSIDVLISRLRRKIEPAPKTPRIILTVPGGGYKLGVAAQAIASPAPPPAAAPADVATSAAARVAPQTPARPFLRRGRSIGISRTLVIAASLVVLASITGLMIAFRPMEPPMRYETASGPPARTFDAAAVPLVDDSVRARFSDYAREPDAKAIAISREGWGLSSGAVDDAAARNEALERCRERDKGGFCRIYAVGDSVVWPSSSLPLPLAADIRADRPTQPAMTPETLDKAWRTMWQNEPPSSLTDYARGRDHRALAVGATRTFYGTADRPSRDDAIRVAIERCSDFARTPCVLIAVDGGWTVEMPRSYAIAAPFTLAGESQMSEAERKDVARVYAGRDWRALARGRSGRWYAVEGRETEAAAVDEAMKACRAAEAECILHAIGNWRVGDKLAVGGG